jgi:flagellar hook-associated protein 3 FlgL
MSTSPALEAFDERGGVRYGAMASEALGWLAAADAAYAQLAELTRRVRGTLLTAMGRRVIDVVAADRVDRARGHVIEVANAGYRGRPVFGGSVATEQAYDADGRYLGDDGIVLRAVGPQAIVRINQTGHEVFGRSPDDLFGLLAGIAAALRTDVSALRGCLARLDAATARINAAQEAEIAVRARVQVEQARQAPDIAAVAQSPESGELAVDASCARASYQAALQTTASVRQLSLVEFLI